MRDLTELNRWRLPEIEQVVYGHSGGDRYGVFGIRSPVDGLALNIIASRGGGWEHVSVSREDRTPTWREMEAIRRHFFKRDECVIQIHPPLDDYIDGSWPGGKSRFTLHLWRPTNAEIPRPPIWMVGARSREESNRFHEIGDAYLAEHSDESD